MTILRQYSLPNCKLILQGVGDPAAPPDPIRPLLSILVNAECHFSGYEQPIQGGREFFESLAACVSQYAQEFLSGIQHPIAQGVVQLQKIDGNRHRLTVLSQEGSQPQAIDLGTVQLFDLVEAIDQFVADPQTLPDFKLSLAPLSKRYVASSEPIAQRAAPVAIGLSSLAAAAALLFFVPIPEVRRPEPAGTNNSPDTVGQVSPTPTTPAAGSPPAETPSPSPTDTPIGESTPSPTGSPTASPSPGATPSEAEVTALLNNAPEITSPERLRSLTLGLRDQLDRTWAQRPPAFTEPLEYRVAVSEQGDILGFKFVNDASIAHVRETPLLDESYQPIDPNASNREPIAQMRVVFTPRGVVQVSPW